jgi:hypothetical protein
LLNFGLLRGELVFEPGRGAAIAIKESPAEFYRHWTNTQSAPLSQLLQCGSLLGCFRFL